MVLDGLVDLGFVEVVGVVVTLVVLDLVLGVVLDLLGEGLEVGEWGGRGGGGGGLGLVGVVLDLVGGVGELDAFLGHVFDDLDDWEGEEL